MNGNFSRHLKKVIAAAIVLTLVAGAAPVQNFAPLPNASLTASAESTSGTYSTWNGDVNWGWNSDTKTLTFSGSGEAKLPQEDGVKLYQDEVESIVIKNGIATIGYSAFSDCTSLKSVSIADSVESIAWQAFSGCTSLTSVNIPASITYLSSTFEGCTSLTSVNIPDSVTELRAAFEGCTSLTSVDIPDSVTELRAAFEGCTSLTTVNIPEGVTDLESAFSGCTSLTSVDIPDSVTELSSAFEGCTSLTTVNIPEGVKYLESAFRDCTNLTTVNIPEGVTDLNYAFENCTSLTSAVIPVSVTEAYKAFSGCTSLSSVTISEGVTEIRDYTFEGCTSLKSIVFPSSVEAVGSGVFNGCTALKDITFAGDDAIFFYDWAFNGLTEDVTVEVPRKSYGGSGVYRGCEPDLWDNEYIVNGKNPRFFGDATVVIRDNGVTYTKVEAVEPTCTTEGNKEYYRGSDGKFYWDEMGYKEVDDTVENDREGYGYIIPANGHGEKINWIWKKQSDGTYTAAARFSCYAGDLDTQSVTATVTSEATEGGITYHAVAACPLENWTSPYWLWDWSAHEHEIGHEVTADYFVETEKYSVTVEGGAITEATQKDKYDSNDCVTVTADKEKDGMFFTGWYIGDKCVSTNSKYTFFVTSDTTVTAKYEEQEEEQQAVVSLTLTRTKDTSSYYDTQKVAYVDTWSIPDGCKLVEAGVLRAYDMDITDVTPDNAKANGVTQNKSSLKTKSGTYKLNVRMKSSSIEKTVYAKSYVIYTDSKGVKHTVISDMQTSEYVEE